MYLVVLLGFVVAFCLFGYLGVGTLLFGDISTLPESVQGLAEKLSLMYTVMPLIFLINNNYSFFSEPENKVAAEQFMFGLVVFTLIASAVFLLLTAILFRPLDPDTMLACLIAWTVCCFACFILGDLIFSAIASQAAIVAYPLSILVSAAPLVAHVMK